MVTGPITVAIVHSGVQVVGFSAMILAGCGIYMGLVAANPALAPVTTKGFFTLITQAGGVKAGIVAIEAAALRAALWTAACPLPLP